MINNDILKLAKTESKKEMTLKKRKKTKKSKNNIIINKSLNKNIPNPQYLNKFY